MILPGLRDLAKNTCVGFTAIVPALQLYVFSIVLTGLLYNDLLLDLQITHTRLTALFSGLPG